MSKAINVSDEAYNVILQKTVALQKKVTDHKVTMTETLDIVLGITKGKYYDSKEK